MTDLGPEYRLATYGTLAPGRSNHHQVSDLGGRWFTGSVKGILYKQGWGSDQGCPGIVPSEDSGVVAVHVLEASNLPAHWDRLEAIEGDEYQRVIVPVRLENDETLDCSIYALRRSP